MNDVTIDIKLIEETQRKDSMCSIRKNQARMLELFYDSAIHRRSKEKTNAVIVLLLYWYCTRKKRLHGERFLHFRHKYMNWLYRMGGFMYVGL